MVSAAVTWGMKRALAPGAARGVSNQQGQPRLPESPHRGDGPRGELRERPAEVPGDAVDGDHMLQRKGLGAPETELKRLLDGK